MRAGGRAFGDPPAASRDSRAQLAGRNSPAWLPARILRLGVARGRGLRAAIWETNTTASKATPKNSNRSPYGPTLDNSLVYRCCPLAQVEIWLRKMHP